MTAGDPDGSPASLGGDCGQCANLDVLEGARPLPWRGVPAQG